MARAPTSGRPLSALLGAFCGVRRQARRLLLEVVPPRLLPLVIAILGVCAGVLLAGSFALLFLRSNADSLTASTRSVALDVGANTLRGGRDGMLDAFNVSDDMLQYANDHWRMLTPSDPPSSFDVFLTSIISSFRPRTFGKPCLVHALKELAPLLPKDSLWLEFGVWRGNSLNMISAKSKELGRHRQVFGFDAFKGLPETWRKSTDILGDTWAKRWTEKGAFDLGGEAPAILIDTEATELVVGWFNESLPAFLERTPGKVSLLHIDSDLYSSAATVLKLVGPRLMPGAIIIFDELLNYPGFQEGEMLALHEWLESPGFREAGHTALQVIGYRGPGLLVDNDELATVIREQRGEGRKYPQDALLRVW